MTEAPTKGRENEGIVLGRLVLSAEHGKRKSGLRATAAAGYRINTSSWALMSWAIIFNKLITVTSLHGPHSSLMLTAERHGEDWNILPMDCVYWSWHNLWILRDVKQMLAYFSEMFNAVCVDVIQCAHKWFVLMCFLDIWQHGWDVEPEVTVWMWFFKWYVLNANAWICQIYRG